MGRTAKSGQHDALRTVRQRSFARGDHRRAWRCADDHQRRRQMGAATDTGIRDHLFAVTFAPENPLLGWAVGTFGSIIATTDGGKTWKPQTSQTSSHLFSVAFATRRHGIAVGSRGTLSSHVKRRRRLEASQRSSLTLRSPASRSRLKKTLSSSVIAARFCKRRRRRNMDHQRSLWSPPISTPFSLPTSCTVGPRATAASC